MSSDLLTSPVVPIAGPKDAEATYRALRSHTTPDDCRPLVIHVRSEGAASDSAETQRGRAAFERFESCADTDGMAIDTGIYEGSDIAETIIDAAREADASAIVFCSRGGSAWFDLLAGGVRTSLVAKSEIPVVMLPTETA